MKDKINVAELLKDCPKGMELDCMMYDNLSYDYVNEEQNRIYCKVDLRDTVWFTIYGCVNLSPNAKCVIFPKDKTTWEGFVPPIKYKDGDVVISTSNNIHLISCRDKKYGGWQSCCGIIYDKFDSTKTAHVIPTRLATEEEKQELFQAIKDNGYKWNPETKTLEKLPRFKVGNRIKEKEGEKIAIVERVYKDSYDIRFDIDNGIGSFTIDLQDEWELVPNKFDITTLKPFDKVLVRDLDKKYWCINFFGFYSEITEQFHCLGNTEIGWDECIPYEHNEHLLGSTADCDDFYKTW